MSLIQKEKAIEAIEQRAADAGGMARTYYERAIQAVLEVPEVVVEKKAAEWKTGNPRRKGRYLTHIICPEGVWLEIDKYEGKGKWVNPWSGDDASDYVQHWMELPDAP